jgi:hypothetical protein
MQPEAKLKRKISAMLKRFNVQYIMPIGGAFSASGVSDYILNVNGNFWAVEVKTDTGKLTALQEKFLGTTIQHNGTTFVVYGDDGVDELERILSRLVGSEKNGVTWV